MQDILGCVIVDGTEPSSINQTTLDAAWSEDAGSSNSDSSTTLPSDRFRSSLATLATVCSSDGTPQTAAACLASLLEKYKEQPERWKRLIPRYSAVAQSAAEAAAGGGSSDPSKVAAAGTVDNSTDELDALLGEDMAQAAEASARATGRAAVTGAKDDKNEISSLGLTHAASQSYSAAVKGGVAASSSVVRRRTAAARAVSNKSIEDPELRRALSDASSTNLDELLPDDLEMLLERQGSHAKTSTRLAKLLPSATAAAASSTHADGGTVCGSGASPNGHLVDMDLRSWVAMKDMQQPGRGTQAVRLAAPLPPQARRADVNAPASDQHLKGGRAAAGQGLPSPVTVIAPGNPTLGYMERDRIGGVTQANGVVQYGSHDSPTRSLAGKNLSRKLSISEPGPMGQQAEWKHLPALGQASRLYPPELRQMPYGAGRPPTVPSRGRGIDAASALVDDKLPALPALAGARGQPPKAMELMRRTSGGQRLDGYRSDGHRAPESQAPPRPHLPGLAQGGKVQQSAPQGPRSLLCVQSTRKKSFRDDNYF